MPGVDLRVQGTKELRQLGRDLRQVADPALRKSLRQELASGFERATRDVKVEIKRSAIETLPKHGGLGAWVADLGIKTTHRIVGRNISVRIVGSLNNKQAAAKRRGVAARKAGRALAKAEGRKFDRSQFPDGRTFGKVADLNAINRGRVMHPVWGHLRRHGKGMVGPQFVRPGFFTRPFEGVIGRRCQKECLKAIEEVRRRIAAGGQHAA